MSKNTTNKAPKGEEKKEPLKDPIETLNGGEPTPTNTGASTLPPKEEKPKGEEMVQIKKSDLDKMFKQMEKQSEDIKLLYKVSDTSRLARELNKEGANLIKTVKVWTWDDTGRFIISWKLISNRCEVVMGKWIEEQNVIIILEDGETMTVPYLEFVRKTLRKVTGDLIGKSEDYDSNENKIIMCKVQFPNGKVLSVQDTFLN